MYLKMSEVTLILDPKAVSRGDPPVYRFRWGAEDALTTDDAVTKSRGAVRYGVLYFDTQDRPCVLPDDIEAARQNDFYAARRVVE